MATPKNPCGSLPLQATWGSIMYGSGGVVYGLDIRKGLKLKVALEMGDSK